MTAAVVLQVSGDLNLVDECLCPVGLYASNGCCASDFSWFGQCMSCQSRSLFRQLRIRLRLHPKALSTVNIMIWRCMEVSWIGCKSIFRRRDSQCCCGKSRDMSAIDGDIDLQELELINQVAEGIEGDNIGFYSKL